jgi:hypothetical protein
VCQIFREGVSPLRTLGQSVAEDVAGSCASSSAATTKQANVATAIAPSTGRLDGPSNTLYGANTAFTCVSLSVAPSPFLP